jgi:hypothetical protein
MLTMAMAGWKRVPIVAVSLGIGILLSAGRARADEVAPPDRPDGAMSDVWIASTRHLPCCTPPENAGPQFYRLQPDGAWAASDEQAFQASDRSTIATIVFIHGNRSDSGDAAEDGRCLCEELRQLAPGVPFRFVIWSWPADRIAGRNRKDLEVKAERSEVEAVYLARFLGRLHGDVPVSLIGYSYGGHAVVGALRLLAGGCFAGQALASPVSKRTAPTSAVLVAAATDWAGLGATACGPSALAPVDRLLVTRNGMDPVLRLYPHLYHRRGPEALGYAGPAGLDPGDRNAQKVEVIDVSCEVGKRHGWEWYRDAPTLRARLAGYALLEAAPSPGPDAAKDR